MKVTFTATGRAFVSANDGQRTFVRGGKDKVGLLTIDMGASTTVTLEVSVDGGTSWLVESTYTTDTVKKVSLPNAGAIYTLNCTTYNNPTVCSLSGS